MATDDLIDRVRNWAGGKPTPARPNTSGGGGDPYGWPTIAAPDDGPRYIGGMPDNYSVLPQMSPGMSQIPDGTSNFQPRYREGAEWDLIGKMTPAQIEKLQRALEAGGLLSSSDYSPGNINGNTVAAFEFVLGQANSQGKAWETLVFGQGGLSNSIGGGGGGGGGGRAPLTTQVSNPSTLRRLFRQAMVEMTGSKQDGFNVDQMVEAYQAVERQYQISAYGKQETGGELVAPPDANTFAQDQLESQYGNEVGANNFAEQAGGLLARIASGSL